MLVSPGDPPERPRGEPTLAWFERVMRRGGGFRYSRRLVMGSGDPTERRRKLATLFAEAEACTACSRMPGHPKTLGPQNGSVEARCLVIATAPGVEGSAATGVPLRGDRAGTNFERLLASAGVRRERLFITNALLCPPRTEAGRSRRPRREELRNCSRFVSGLIVQLAPALVVTLGSTALAALEQLAPHGLTLARDAGRPIRTARLLLLRRR
ncbi:MAG TPA: uracil-DNA glycosylase family protein, partial [Polyangiaceae bacterium LLY-WYZ-15_(1-7)]|nr:uracil-DNA glycosylase family protein [Polyangiaceae bacterium LLY-WYZ-15_(1-7)]